MKFAIIGGDLRTIKLAVMLAKSSICIWIRKSRRAKKY